MKTLMVIAILFLGFAVQAEEVSQEDMQARLSVMQEKLDSLDKKFELLVLDNCSKYAELVLQFKVMLKRGMTPGEIMEQRVHPYIKEDVGRKLYIGAIGLSAKYIKGSESYTREMVLSNCVRAGGPL